jgi:hypothetical protein
VTRRQQWITWGLTALSAVIIGLLTQKPIILPPIPIPGPGESPGGAPPVAPAPKPDPLNAIVRIGRSGAGCSATIIGPRRADGRYWVLSAAHCCERIGERWQAKFRDGRTTGLVVTALNRQADYAWMLTDVDTQVFPFALLAAEDPAPGAKVWHAGYGVHVPGNTEEGEVAAGRNSDGQIEFRLSVSSGDSGGGICLTDKGEVISPVCCTTRLSGPGRVWGASPVVCLRGQAVAAWVDEWVPTEMPIVIPRDMAPAKAP